MVLWCLYGEPYKQQNIWGLVFAPQSGWFTYCPSPVLLRLSWIDMVLELMKWNCFPSFPIVQCIVNKLLSGKSSFVLFHRYAKWALPVGLHHQSKVGKFVFWHQKNFSILGSSPPPHLTLTPQLQVRLLYDLTPSKPVTWKGTRSKGNFREGYDNPRLNSIFEK